MRRLFTRLSVGQFVDLGFDVASRIASSKSITPLYCQDDSGGVKSLGDRSVKSRCIGRGAVVR